MRVAVWLVCGPERSQFFTVGVADWLGSGWLIGSCTGPSGLSFCTVGVAVWLGCGWLRLVYGPERPQFFTVGVAAWLLIGLCTAPSGFSFVRLGWLCSGTASSGVCFLRSVGVGLGGT